MAVFGAPSRPLTPLGRQRGVLRRATAPVSSEAVGTLPTLGPRKPLSVQRRSSVPEGAMQGRGYSSGATALLDTFHRSLAVPSKRKSTARRFPAATMLM